MQTAASLAFACRFVAILVDNFALLVHRSTIVLGIIHSAVVDRGAVICVKRLRRPLVLRSSALQGA